MTATWHTKDVGDGVDAAGPSLKLHEAFFHLVKSGGMPASAAGFGRYDLWANVLTWWFTPQASMLAQAFEAAPCEKPIPEPGFSFLVGDPRAWQVHFPGYIPSRR